MTKFEGLQTRLLFIIATQLTLLTKTQLPESLSAVDSAVAAVKALLVEFEELAHDEDMTPERPN